MVRLLRELWVDIRRMKHYIFAATLVFLIGAYLGATDPRLVDYIEKSVEGLGEIAIKIQKSEHPQLLFFAFIFFQ